MYAALGWVVWKGVKSYVRLRYGDKARNIAIGVGVVGGIGVALAAQRKSGDS